MILRQHVPFPTLSCLPLTPEENVETPHVLISPRVSHGSWTPEVRLVRRGSTPPTSATEPSSTTPDSNPTGLVTRTLRGVRWGPLDEGFWGLSCSPPGDRPSRLYGGLQRSYKTGGVRVTPLLSEFVNSSHPKGSVGPSVSQSSSPDPRLVWGHGGNRVQTNRGSESFGQHMTLNSSCTPTRVTEYGP